MKKKLTLVIAILAATAFQLNAQCEEENTNRLFHPRGLPPGPIGSYNNPIFVYANLGELATMGDYSISPTAPWYSVTGWWQSAPRFHLYYDVWGLHRGQFLSKWTDTGDYRDGVIYAVADPNHGYVFEFFRILRRPDPPCATSER